MKNLQKISNICFLLLFIMIYSGTVHGQTKKISITVSAGLANLPITDFDNYYSTDFNNIIGESFYLKNPHLSGSLSLEYCLNKKHILFLESEIIKTREFYVRDVVLRNEFKQWNITGMPFTLGYRFKIKSLGRLDLFVESGLSYITTDINSEMTIFTVNGNLFSYSLEYLLNSPINIDVIKDKGFGGHIAAGINVDIQDRTFMFFRARYRYAPVMTIMSGYDDEVDFDFTGYYFNLGFGYSF
ncbi:outer membrane beta-barrel protein [candidate division KSB1 bacterium]